MSIFSRSVRVIHIVWISLAIIFVFTCAVFLKAEEIGTIVPEIKKQLFGVDTGNTEYVPTVPDVYSLEEFGSIKHHDESWYNNNKLIAHAMGGIDGIDYTNSLEAAELSHSNGLRIFEADFMLTADGHPVLVHSWGDHFNSTSPLYLDDFKEFKLQYKYTPMTFDDLLLFLEQNPDVYVVTDTKYDNNVDREEKLKLLFSTLASHISAYNESLFERFIIQIYFESDYYLINDIHEFDNYLYTTYKVGIHNIDDAAKFCLEKNIPVIAVPVHEVCQITEWISEINNSGIKIFTYTVNKLDTANELFSEGIYGVYTDYLTRDDLELIGIESAN